MQADIPDRSEYFPGSQKRQDFPCNVLLEFEYFPTEHGKHTFELGRAYFPAGHETPGDSEGEAEGDADGTSVVVVGVQ